MEKLRTKEEITKEENLEVEIQKRRERLPRFEIRNNEGKMYEYIAASAAIAFVGLSGAIEGLQEFTRGNIIEGITLICVSGLLVYPFIKEVYERISSFIETKKEKK
ncbi:MAG: hypothetical protein ACP5FX_02745 [Candidatus Micrarchaeia archaeon]